MTDIVLRTKLAKYLTLRQEIKDLKKELEGTRDELVPYIKSQGRENAAGSKVLELDTPVKMGDDNFQTMQYTRKSSKRLNEEKALEFLRSDQAFECAIIAVEHVDQDALWDLYVNDLIPQEVFDSFYEETVTWSFNPIAE